MILLYVQFNHLDIGIKLRDVGKHLFRVFFHTPDKNLPPISRDPDEMILGFIDGVGTFSEFHSIMLSNSISSG